MIRRMQLGLAGAAVAAVLGVAGVAWACTEQSSLKDIRPSSAAAGSQVTVAGTQFGDGPVAIRWGSPSGQLLATAPGPDPSVRVTIPQVQPGSYYVYAVQNEFQRSTTFTVTGPRGAAPGESGAAPGQGGAAPGAQASDDPEPVVSPEAAQATAAADNAPVAGQAPAKSAGPAKSAKPTSAPAQSVRSRPAARAGSPAPPAADPQSAPVMEEQAAPELESGPLPDPRTVAGDLWSGFAPGSTTGPAGPGLAGEPIGSHNGSLQGAGVALLALGVLTMAAGSGLAVRRRARAHADSR
ncbi:MAG: hypothetical protein M3P85_12375 [Actinomycetota bacterium]|nr:hypothetical protein [Actinomycetota bacterium]